MTNKEEMAKTADNEKKRRRTAFNSDGINEGTKDAGSERLIGF
jgi:hypothetical protein